VSEAKRAPKWLMHLGCFEQSLCAKECAWSNSPPGSNFECSMALCVVVTADSAISLFCSFLVLTCVNMPLISTVYEQLFSRKNMRLAESATVSNFERLKPPYVGVTVDSVIRLFFFCE